MCGVSYMYMDVVQQENGTHRRGGEQRRADTPVSAVKREMKTPAPLPLFLALPAAVWQCLLAPLPLCIPISFIA